MADSDCLFIDVYCGWSGRLHDQRLFRESVLGCDLLDAGSQRFADMTSNSVLINEDYEMNYVLVADSAYSPSPFLVPCFRDVEANTVERRIFNTKLSRTRVVIERAYGMLKNRWRMLLKTAELALPTVVNVVVACCVLHNFCQLEKQPLPIDDREYQVALAEYQEKYPKHVAEGDAGRLVTGTDEQVRDAPHQHHH